MRAPGCQARRLQAGCLRFPGKEEGAVRGDSWVLRWGQRAPPITQPSQFPEALGRLFLLQEARLSATWPLSVPSQLPTVPFPKDGWTLSRKPGPQMPPEGARRGSKRHALSWAREAGVGASGGLASAEPGWGGSPGRQDLGLPTLPWGCPCSPLRDGKEGGWRGQAFRAKLVTVTLGFAPALGPPHRSG